MKCKPYIWLFRFESLSDFEELMKKARQDEELNKIQQHFHSVLIKPVFKDLLKKVPDINAKWTLSFINELSYSW